MRRVLVPAIAACLTAGAGCASRSSLDHSPRGQDASSDASPEPTSDATTDAGSRVDSAEPDAPTFETWSVEAGGPACSTRAKSCLIGHDFGPSKAVADVFTACAASVGAACGDLLMAFDAEGCLVEVREIRDYSPAFVDCVREAASATRWECAAGKNLRMFQACP